MNESLYNVIPKDDAVCLGDCSEADLRDTFSRLTDYVARQKSTPVIGDWREGQIAALAGDFPEEGRGIGAALDIFDEKISAGLLPWNNPGFMGFFGISAPLPALAAQILTTSHNSNRMVTIASPAAPELDFLAGKWFRKFLNVPEEFDTQFFYSASQSHMHALGAALNRKTCGRSRAEGLAAINLRFRIYKSENAHFFVDKNANVTGIGLDNVVSVAAMPDGSMNPNCLESSIRADLERGFVPLMVVATVGTTATNAVDPVAAIADICSLHGIYLYVDAAFAGAFAALPEFEWVRDGWDRADAICINPHKQLMVPLGCSMLFLKDREELRRTYYHGGAYIPEHANQQPDPMDFTALCGMPINTLAPIFLMLTFGAEGLRRRIRNTVALARKFAWLIAEDGNFEFAAPYRFSTVCFRSVPHGVESADGIGRFNAWIAKEVLRSRTVFISPTKLAGNTALRLTVGNINTTEKNIEEAYQVLREAAEKAGRLFSFRVLRSGGESTAARHGSGQAASFWSRVPPSLIERKAGARPPMAA